MPSVAGGRSAVAKSPIALPVVTGVLRAIDGAGALAAGLSALWWSRVGVGPHEATTVLLGSVLAMNLLHFAGVYRRESIAQLNAALSRCLAATLLTACCVVAVHLATAGWHGRSPLWLQAWFATYLFFVLFSRVVATVLFRHWRAQGRLGQVVAVFGAGPIGQALLRQLNAQSAADVRVVGVYDDRLSRLPTRCMGHPILGNLDTLVGDVRARRIDTVIVALPLTADRRIGDILRKLRNAPVQVALCPDLAGLRLGAIRACQAGGVGLISAVPQPLSGWPGVVKAIEDRVLAALILLLIAPLMAAIALAIRLDSPGPVLFRQKRYGYNNRLIDVYKFRTMHHHAEDTNAEQLTRRNDPRITRIGAFLRRTSLDELPRFINVLRGEMSVVGPRPHALAAKAGGLLYPEAVRDYHARHRVKPGITGWAQVNGWRGETETVEQIERRVEHDLFYIDHWSVALDLRIVLRTILGGFTGRNAF
ncbi:MAG: undecaprenyl-phosphate glucose phosphotransferase [Alphaproteobacteria bacterium]|nr:undecaprenyl-phosphate glucose phosphotransferase [Alphaproteobacteria bacterium]